MPSSIPDAAERSAALDISRSFIVEAPAGSGKTALLIQRFLKLLADPNVTDPAQVLALTFTRKSTHEMRDRIFKQLQAAALDEPIDSNNHLARATRPLALAALARDRALGWNLLERPDRLNISTIDALCIRVAGALPVVTGAGGQSPVEDARTLYDEAARQTLDQLGTGDPALTQALQTLLLHRDGNLGDCERHIAEMLRWRDQWANLVPLFPTELTDTYLETTALPRLEKALELVVCRTLTTLNKLMPPALCRQLSLLAREMSFSDGYNGAENPLTICRTLPSDPGTAAAALDHWKLLARLLLTKGGGWRKRLHKKELAFEILEHHGSELERIIAALGSTPGLRDALCSLTRLPPLTYPLDQWLVVKALLRVLSEALVRLQFVFAARRECDFTQFSLLARDGLASSEAAGDLAASTGLNLQHLLVDEMQDTSSSQYELLHLLTRHWDGFTRTLFLVGDPRQSIYLFRQARVERFIETLQHCRLGDVPLSPIFLLSNFRSGARLVQQYNETFSLLFPAHTLPASSVPSDSASLPYRDAFATRPSNPDGAPALVWHPSIVPHDPDDPHSGRRTQLQRNAAEIRSLVEQWRGRSLPAPRTKPWKIAVLVRNRVHLVEIVRAFKQHPPISFRAVQIEPLAERQEILDLLALTRALLHPADRTAWLALLRTPWCGLTLPDLHLLAGEDHEEHRKRTVQDLIAERGHLLSEDGIARLQPFSLVLSAAVSRRGLLPLSQWVERTWRTFSAHAFCTLDQRRNVTRFFELLDDLESRTTPISISSLHAAMTGLYAAESTEPGTVDLMTIHSAKGLEWDFVVVPRLEAATGTDRGRLLNWTELEPGSDDDSVAHGIIAPLQSKGNASEAMASWIRGTDAARTAAERNRLFYVACTRAREEIHLFASPRRKADGEIDLNYSSLLKTAWPAAESHFLNAEAEPHAQDQPLLQIAAAGLTLVPPPASPPQPTIRRVPLQYLCISNAPPSPLLAAGPHPIPQKFRGSFEARTLGNATHSFLELLAQRIADGSSPEQLLIELPAWSPRITGILRAGGLSPDRLSPVTSALLRSLIRTLQDADGCWLLRPHPEASSECSITSAEGTIRLDRTFLAGNLPQSSGSTHRWIVDFKTGSHGAAGVDAFLAAERLKFAPQLESYARHLASDALPIRLALYFPAIPRLLWWPFESTPSGY